MKSSNNHVWINAEQLNNDPAFLQASEQEFFELPLLDALGKGEEMAATATNRRDFLKFLGFGIGAATLASCQIPVRKAIPYVVRPDELVPGIANYYASSFVNGGDYGSVLVKTREGRPIKIEPNTTSSVTSTGTSARAQAVVLSLYDTNRLKGAGKVAAGGKVTAMEWSALDAEIKSKLTAGAQVRILANTILSPATKKAVAEFTAKFPNTKLVQYDAVSAAGMLLANQASFGKQVIPGYRFDLAEVIVSFGADFLGTWISPTEYTTQYATNRRVARELKEVKMNRHYQFESSMSITGSNADHRVLVRPSEMGAALLNLYAALGGSVTAPKINDKAAKAVKTIADDLKKAGSKALVVSGSNSVQEQIIVNAINAQLGAIGTTVDFGNYSNQRQGLDKPVQDLFAELNNGTVDALFVMDANPVYDLPNGEAFGKAIAKAKLAVSFHNVMNETTAVCGYVAPDHHLLESWGDAEPRNGKYSLIQPTIMPIFKTRQAPASLLVWAGSAAYNDKAESPYYEFLKAFWQKEILGSNTQAAWDTAVHNGVFEKEVAAAGASFNAGTVAEAAAKIAAAPIGTGVEVSFYESVQIGDGRYANNPWLQEMPDPVTRCTWDNHVLVPIEWDATTNGFKGFNDLKDGDLVDVTIDGKVLTLPVVRQFGQMKNTIAIALGYGRTMAGDCGTGVGVNVYPFLKMNGDTNTYAAQKITVSASKGRDKAFACVQMHHTYGVQAAGSKDNVDEKALGIPGMGFQGALTGRSVVYTTDLEEAPKFLKELEEKRADAKRLNKESIYGGHDDLYTLGNQWAMSIDLSACTGCGSCTVACMAENNVPVVGKFEVARVHEMAWIRIDRYYYGDVENPNTIYQPMMCQHCDNAPCENVCPVAATNHSSEGLNQMTYNRCIGTRYCANNCPYKVRRFNWMDYTSGDLFAWNENKLKKSDLFGGEVGYMEDNLTRMVLNPDVTVRSRGVIEKCTFCVQRIQEGKLAAKKESRRLRDSDIKTACQTACPTGAIIFGNSNNKESQVVKALDHDLTFYSLEEVDVAPGIGYRTRVTNKNKALA